jgi:hypothetical protein
MVGTSITPTMNHQTRTRYRWQPSWTSQLITPEDRFHIHKTLGLLVAVSTIFRLSLLFVSRIRSIISGNDDDNDGDMGFRSHPEWTIPTVILHAALTLTSFQFQLPARRIKSGYRIWPEYRLHSLVFLFRSLVAILLSHFCLVSWSAAAASRGTTGGDGGRPAYEDVECYYYGPPSYTHLILVLSTMGMADLASSAMMVPAESSSGFCRDLDAPAVIRYFFSVAQCGATAYVLVGHTTRTPYDDTSGSGSGSGSGSCRGACGDAALHFVFILIIQWNAFFMTLQRKNLARRSVLMTIYGLLLAGGIVTARVPPLTKTVVHVAALLRIGPRGWWLPGPLRLVQDNKYVLWTLIYLMYVHAAGPIIRHLAWLVPILDGVTLVPVLWLGYYKHREEQRAERRRTKTEANSETMVTSLSASVSAAAVAMSTKPKTT